jgi:disulfide bond formation protein DsbB
MLIDQANLILSFLVLLGQVLTILLLVWLIFFRNKKIKIFNLFIDKAILWSFIISLVATLGSLYYSQIAHFLPCELCWFQRICIYPQVILLGLALIKKSSAIIDYSLALLSVGLIISLYHNYIYYNAATSSVCSIVAPCTQQYVTGFNFITIPLMSLTTIVLIGLLLISKRLQKA